MSRVFVLTTSSYSRTCVMSYDNDTDVGGADDDVLFARDLPDEVDFFPLGHPFGNLVGVDVDDDFDHRLDDHCTRRDGKSGQISCDIRAFYLACPDQPL